MENIEEWGKITVNFINFFVYKVYSDYAFIFFHILLISSQFVIFNFSMYMLRFFIGQEKG
jgi:hypothetical protein